MPIRTAISSLLTQLRTVSVVNNEGNTTTLNAAPFNNQIERKRTAEGYTYATPAAFVETLPETGGMIGMMTSGYDVVFRIHLEHEKLNEEGYLDENLDIFDLRDKVLRKLNGFRPTGCGPLAYLTEQHDHNHTNTYVLIIDFKCHYIELSSSIEDTELYQEGEYDDVVIRVNGEEPGLPEPPFVGP
jgi:hypothetical protein